MKRYLLSIYQPDEGTPPPEVLEPIMRDMGALIAEMRERNVWVFNGGLYPPSTATTVKYASNDDVLLTDGPYLEGKEHIGGFIVIRAADLDAALEWGKRVAAVLKTLSIEVRPFVDDGQ